MRFSIALCIFLLPVGAAFADELDDNYAAIKQAEQKKDPDQVTKLALETSKSAKAEAAQKQPSDASEVEHWKQRVEFAKEVEDFAEYSLSTTAIANPSKAVELVDTLIQINPKSKYLGACASTYLQALGPKRQTEGAQKILNGDPNSEEALFAMASGTMNGAYATRLVNVMKSKAKPEGMSEGDWDKKKTLFLGQGYYIAGAAACTKSTWTDCDRDLRAALAYVSKEPAVAGPTYFYLGLADYNLSKLTGDRAKLTEAEKFSEQSAAIAGPTQAQAQKNVAIMKQELAGGGRR
ncbi:MAG TPA: hypothetical protein VIY49_09170 [Bryobacteraceae bacterium]